MMKLLAKTAAAVSILICFVALPAATVHAQLEQACTVEPGSDLCQENTRTPGDRRSAFYGPNGVLTRVARFVSLIAGIAAVIMIIIAGFRLITAGGDSNSIGNARDAITYAVIGLVVAGAAQALILFVLNRL